ncbi:XrtA/PEP-CTERM system TPR-repeat protein PrsT [Paraglaciecola sp. 20A4]|uniref:XrtA/PEP-CTERM system TPR-repeat protein PrsT n=1 Tax=Paraglaciecola sp. 20A4 TaxID=2687288 RepID=UPI00140E46E9|nr:XrtA/PEP-CTERM system TPR-repeat protein PrsT [Paraglaciecola sp. 20A4]
MRIKLLSYFVALSALTLTGCDSKTAEEYIAAAKTQYQQNDTQAAIIDLKNAIALAPQNKDARANLGQYYLEAGFFDESEKELRKALELGEEKDSIYPSLVKAIYYQNDFDRLIRLTQDFNSDDPEVQSSVDLFTFLAILKDASNDDVINTDFSTLIGDDKILAQVYYDFSQGNFSQANEFLSDFQDLTHNKIEKLIVTGLIKAQLEEYEAAINALEQVVSSSPEYYVIQFQFAEILIKAGNIEKAKTLINGLLEVNANSAYAKLLMAQVHINEEEYKKAFDAAEFAIQNGIDTTQSNLLAGISAYKIERTESAYKYLSKASRNIPRDHIANRLLADVKIRLGETNNLAELLEGLSGQDVQKSALLESAAMIKFREGDLEESKNLFAQAKEGAPDNAVTLLREGLVKLSAGDLSGIDSLESAIELDNTLSDAWNLLAQAHMQAKEPKKALAVALRWQQINQVDGLVLESYLLQQVNDDATARKRLNKALELAPDNYPAMRFLMLMNAREKRFDEARALAETLLESSNNADGKFQLILTLINLAIQQNDLKSVESILQSLVEKQATDDKNEALELKVGLATIYNYQGEYQKALDILKGIEVKNDFFVLSELGQTYIEMDDFKNAKSTFQTLVSAFPRNTVSWNKLINLLNQYGLHAEAAEVASSAEAAIPRDPRLTVLNIRALIRAGDIRKAKQKIDKMKTQGNSSPMFELFEGEIALHDKEYEKASKLLRHYYSEDPSWDTAIPLAKALAKLGQVPSGGKYLVEQTAKSRVKFKNIHYIAEYYAQNGELDSAAIYYKGLLDLNPKDFVTLNNYSALAIEQGNVAQAIELAQKAIQIYPESPYAMDTLGWALFHDKKYGDALTYIKKAHEALPQNNEISLHLIEVLISTGSKDKAKALSNRLKPANDREKQILSRLSASI